MNWIDFIIGIALMNAMPHFIFGVWKGRALSAFGFGNTQNIMYSMVNFLIAIGLFVYKYGGQGIMENGIFAGALSVLITYYLTGNILYKLFNRKTND